MYENNPQEPQPPYGQHPQSHQPQQPHQGSSIPQQPQFGQQQGWEQQPRRGRPPGPPRGRKQQSGGHRVRNVVLGLVGGLALVIVIAAVASNGNNGNSPASNSLNNPPAAQATAPSSPAATTAPSPSPAAPPSPTPPSMTVSQQQAVDSAQSYLQTEPGFSYQGLIDQLDSSAGEGFSVADATFAVNYVAPATDTTFWDAQAVDSAKSYMQTEPGWSACGLVQQLDSSAGEQFTQAEAEYAVQQVGLGSC